MACDLTTYVQAPEIQGQLEALWGVNPYVVESFPITNYMFSAENNKGVLKRLIAPGGGKKRTVQLIYPQRRLLSEVSDDITPCTTGAERGNKSSDVTIDPDVGVYVNQLIDEATLRTITQDNKQYVSEVIDSLMTACLRKMERKCATQIAALNGAFNTHDKDYDGGTIGSNVKKVRTRISAGQLDPNAKYEVAKSCRIANYDGAPIVIGEGIYTRDVMMQDMGGVPYDFGVDLGTVARSDQLRVIASLDMYAALEALGAGQGRTHFMTIAPGAIIPVDYQRYTTDAGYAPLQHWSDTSQIKTTMAHPSGVVFDVRIQEPSDKCDNINIEVWNAFVLKGLPSDLYCTGDDLAGNVLAHMFYVQNP